MRASRFCALVLALLVPCSAPASGQTLAAEQLAGLRVRSIGPANMSGRIVDLDVNEGEIVTMIGANGAGKTTLMMTICGNPRAHEGTIEFAGHELTRLATHEIAHLKLAQAPEGRRIFSRMTVLENLQMGAIVSEPSNFKRDLERVLELFPRLQQRMGQRGGTLSGGEQQMLAIARALMGRPRLLLLDEPSLGLSPRFVDEVFDKTVAMARAGLTVMLVEQNAARALEISDRAYVLELGRNRFEGTGQELLHNPEVRRMYLGGKLLVG